MRNRRAPALIAATAVLLAGAAAAMMFHSQPHNGRGRTVTTASAASRPPHDTASRPAPAVPGGLAAEPVIDAARLRWTSFHGIALPVSPQDGPRDTRGGLASGFADTPAGALLAAINIGVRTAAQWGPAIFGPTIHRQVAGPDAAALLRADQAAYPRLRAAAHVRPGQPAGRGYAAEAAYQFVAYTPAGATVDVVTAGPATDGTTVLAVTRIEVIWQVGDWRLIAPPGGDWASAATTASSLSGYRIFPGQE